MRQKIRGVFAQITGLPSLVEQARSALGLTWDEVAAGSPWSRQYLQAQLQRETMPAAVVEHLISRLDIHPDITPTTTLLPT